MVDKSAVTVMVILFVLVVAAIIFYTNPAENQRQIAVGLCEISCHNVTANHTSHSNFCVSKNISYGYSCAISAVSNASVCSNQKTVYINNNCQLIAVG